MGRAGHLARQLRDIKRAAHLVELAPFLQLLGNRQHIHRPLADRQVDNRRENLLVRLLIETLRFQDLAHDRVSVLLEHQRAQDRLLQLFRLGLQPPHIRHNNRFLSPFACRFSCSFCHKSLSKHGGQRYNLFRKRGGRGNPFRGRDGTYGQFMNKGISRRAGAYSQKRVIFVPKIIYKF